MGIVKLEKPYVINFFGQPGAGKSSTSAWIFSQLKMKNVDCEYVQEFAKDIVWQERTKALKNQAYVFGKQVYRLNIVYENTGLAITDSPLPLAIVYSDYGMVKSKYAKPYILEHFNYFNNLNFLVKRVKPYNPNGRNQTEEESNAIGGTIVDLLKDCNIHYFEINGNMEGCEQALQIINEKLFEGKL